MCFDFVHDEFPAIVDYIYIYVCFALSSHVSERPETKGVRKDMKRLLDVRVRFNGRQFFLDDED